MGGTVAYSDVPEGFTVKSSPSSSTSYSDVPEGFSVKDTPKSPESDFQMDPVRGTYRNVANTLYQGINDVGGAVGKGIEAITPQPIEDKLSQGVDYLKKNSALGVAGGILGKAAGAEIDNLSQYNTDLKPDVEALGKNVKAVANIPVVKPVAELSAGLGAKGLGGIREAVNAKSDAMATKVSVTKENAEIIKTLKKAGHSDEEILDIVKRAKEQGMTVGEASNNPDLLGMERKLSGMNRPGGKTVRDFVKNRVDPNNNVSMPFKLKSIADPLAKEVDRASKEIGATVTAAPKTPLNMNNVKTALASEKRPAGSAVTNTLGRIDGLVEWAQGEGNTFEAWHRVKQEIYALGKEASDPNAVAKLDKKTVTQYYNKVNDVLSGRSGGLPADLAETGTKYAKENAAFHQNLSGRTIQDVLAKMPTGGTPASSLKYLYKQLAGNKELQDELFAGIPESQRPGMLKFLEAVKDAGRGTAGDVVKSMQEGSPSFPISTRQVFHKIYDKVIDTITRKDYDALGKALTSPDVEQIAKKLGYIKPTEPAKPILRLTYQPEVHVDRAGGAKVATVEEKAAANATRDRMAKLGYDPGILRAQDLHVIKAIEEKYGASELGKFMVEHKNEPIMGRVWDVPQTEYSQATVDKMMGRDAMSLLKKLDKETQDAINSETRTAWESHQVPLADMIMARVQAAKDLAQAKGETGGTFGKTSLGSAFDEMLKNQ